MQRNASISARTQAISRRPLRAAAVVSCALACVGVSSSLAQAQQFTRNTTDIPASSGYTENVDFADVDGDGDWDAGFADGGDIGNQQNRLWRNSGGVQGGTVGVFVDVTATQFPVVADSSRDIEFVDFDRDGDLDAYVSNHSSNQNQPCRWWTNMGGAQGGTSGFYQDQTATRWAGLGGAGSSIPPSLVLPGGGFVDYSSDGDFGDLDNDGDLDLVHVTHGPGQNGNAPTRIFRNDGAGVFSEFNPSGFQLSGPNISNGNPGIWCQGTQLHETADSTGAFCDVATTGLAVELGDVDGDLDLDILHGARAEKPRLFQNRLEEDGGALGFRDVTGAVFPSGYATGSGRYEQELGDFDADGDLDIYGTNWLVAGFQFNDNTLENDGTGVYFNVTTLSNSSADDEEGDFVDYDLDGDLDLIVANFQGQERAYANDGSGGYTYAATGTVLPTDGTTSRDIEAADVDDDGDPDLFVANDSDQSEWFLRNNTSANDTSAPRLYRLEQAADRAAGSAPTVVRVQVYDNQPYYTTWYAGVVLSVSVNGGPAQSYPMHSSMGQIFRAEIPGLLVGSIAYQAIATDRDGNVGASNTLSFNATGGTPMTSFCDPGVGGVLPCPCGNPPSGAGRGCDNFTASTGGATIAAVGNPSLSNDTLVLTASQENPRAFTIFLQGTSYGSGAAFGAGVRCVTGSLKRLYSGNASAGAISRPTGPPSVSARSAALGDTIGSGESRYYMCYYRDPHAGGPCGNPAATFNGTQSGAIVWGP